MQAWRLGQTRPVVIYRLVVSGTIEEKIYHRQIFKTQLSGQILNKRKMVDFNVGQRHFTQPIEENQRLFSREELRDLFTLSVDESDEDEEDNKVCDAVEYRRKIGGNQFADSSSEAINKHKKLRYLSSDPRKCTRALGSKKSDISNQRIKHVIEPSGSVKVFDIEGRAIQRRKRQLQERRSIEVSDRERSKSTVSNIESGNARHSSCIGIDSLSNESEILEAICESKLKKQKREDTVPVRNGIHCVVNECISMTHNRAQPSVASTVILSTKINTEETLCKRENGEAAKALYNKRHCCPIEVMNTTAVDCSRLDKTAVLRDEHHDFSYKINSNSTFLTGSNRLAGNINCGFGAPSSKRIIKDLMSLNPSKNPKLTLPPFSSSTKYQKND